jgi:hypothetical protein
MDEKNGIWVEDSIKLVDYIADFIQNWLEDNISEDLYNTAFETAKKYSDKNEFETKVIKLFESYSNARISNFESELNKLTSTVNE